MDKKGFAPQKDLLNTEDVARYLGINLQTVWRWCREERLPCLKVGNSWRIRRTALEDFLKHSEHTRTIVGQLRAFLEVPDNVLAISQNLELMYRLDAAFFRVGEAHDGMLIKYYPAELGTSLDELRDQLKRNGLEVTRLEEQGRLHFIAESDPLSKRTEELRRLLAEKANNEGRSIWVAFNWEERVDLDSALRQQEEITKLVEHSPLVVKTGVLEEMLDEWPGTELRRSQVSHLGGMWYSSDGRLVLSRVTSPVQT